MRAGRLLAITSAFLLIWQSGAAQSPSSGPVPTIRTTTEEVLLELVARDKHRRIVTDLEPSQVEVYEDGVRQDIKSFRLVAGANQLQTERAETQASTTAGENTTPQNRLQQLNFISIVFGPTAPLNREFAREAVADFLKSGSLPNTYVTVYALSTNLNLVQPYTGNIDLLTQSVNRVAKGLATGSSPATSTLIAGAVIAKDIKDFHPTASEIDPRLSGAFPGVIARSPLWARNAAAEDASVPLGAALDAQAALATALRFNSSEGMDTTDALRALIQNQQPLPGRKVVLYLSDGLDFPYGRHDVVENLISLANRSGVTFYTVDTRGLSSESPMTAGLASSEMAGVESSAGQTGRQLPLAVTAHHEMDDIEVTAVSNRQLNARELAESTGGFAVADTNQIAEPMQRVMEDIRTHYLISYVPKSTSYDGRFRKIGIKLARHDVNVQTRKGYYALPMLNGEPLQPFEAVALDAINTRPTPANILYDASIMKFRVGTNLVQYMLGIEVSTSELKAAPIPKSNRSLVRASIFAVVRDSQGEVIGKISREVQKQITARDFANLAHDRIFCAEPLALPRGNYTIDTAVTDERSGKASVRRIAVSTVPGVELALSSLLIVGKAEPLAGVHDPVNPFELDNARIIPELADSTPPGAPVTLYFVVYPAKLTTLVQTEATLELLRDGNEVGRQALKLPEPRADGSIPVLLRISPGPGSYAIVVTARQGTLVAESVRSLQIQ